MKHGDPVTVHTPGTEERFPATLWEVSSTMITVLTGNGHLASFPSDCVTPGGVQ